jgi:hypothetical protein
MMIKGRGRLRYLAYRRVSMGKIWEKAGGSGDGT